MAKWGEIKCREAASKCPRCEMLEEHLCLTEEKLEKVTAAYRIVLLNTATWTSHEAFDRHIKEITGGKDD